ncbi:hypothetical protein SAMD00079811_67360 [Scytonema sp. HK-05]|uniref:hypothetical protein n=1 Tax=Scytonema sp. HK-05 TaxID=1137095 RepID=UPI000935BD66|nr:hypothetical protein [Scytonema sp. HK-05]OKH42451.1 hypothetical protein NIES2130_39685 [Scytonema sp. HK-05]BAY49107.1 hypothetical protein SAMD00079811_67360 [Scytonema sp. HK-05]
MTQEPRKPIHLSVHESADPSVISPSPDKEASGNMNDLNDSVHDDENADVPIPGLSDDASDSNPVDRQIGIVGRTAG